MPLSLLRAAAFVGLASLSAPALASERATERATVEGQAVATSAPIAIDGRFDEPVWATAPVIGEFVQREPAEGAAPTERSEVRLAYDDTALYVAFHAFDSQPTRIVGMLTRRDESSPSDWVKVVVDSFHDRRTAYEFAVNPAGVKADRYYFNDGDDDTSWDAVWDVQVAKDTQGWRAEFRIPFSQLRFSEGNGPVGIALIRQVPRANETSTWPLIARSVNGFVSQFGDVSGVRPGSAPKRLELMPYTVANLTTAAVAAGDPIGRSRDPGASVGVDLKYAVTPALTLTATINPDFGQVEADPAAVNLDAFELFFAERRPFFVEGSGVFRYAMDCNNGNCTGLLYSRRIGRQPQGSATTSDGEYAQSPVAATILGAAKLTGRIRGFSVGALSAVTQEERSLIAAGTTRRRQVVEPLTVFNVARARREFANQSNLGVMVTSTTRRLTPDTRFLADNSVVGGVDYDWRIKRRYSIAGFWAGSRVGGGTEAITRLQRNAVHSYQRPDADYVELDPQATSLGGHAGGLSVQKIGGQRTRFSANYGYKSPGFDSNDLGFQRRADEKTMSHWFQVRDQVPGKYVNEFTFNLNQFAQWNFANDLIAANYNVNMHWRWQNNWSNGFGVNVNPSSLRDRATRGGPAVRVNRFVGVWHYLNMDDRRTLAPSYFGFIGGDGQGSAVFDANPFITWRPARALRLETGLRFNRNHDDAQWVENVTDDASVTHHVFGRLEQQTVSMTLRANYTMSPNLSLQVYAEPFVSAGRYERFRELTDARVSDYASRYRPYAYESKPDFNFRSFRTTNVLRWEYKPGSVFFAVWQQGRQESADQGDFRFGRDFGGVFSAPARNVFLLKFSYWFNY